MKLVVGNFKMNLLQDDIDFYLQNLSTRTFTNIVICPSFPYLKSFIDQNIPVGSQDVSPFAQGSYTGDVSAEQLKSLGVKYTIVGHSERRQYYQENTLINRKIYQAVNNDLIPILCIGENMKERESNQTFNILKRQIDEAFKDLTLTKIIIAYEPIWAIGTGVIPTNEEIVETIKYIKDYIKKAYHISLSVLYGGSVNEKNILSLEKVENIDGYLIGGCSLSPTKFMALTDIINKRG